MLFNRQYIVNNLSVLILLFVGATLRFTLMFNTPVDLAFDNHFEPIKLWLESGLKPHPAACFECYQPPFFYGLMTAFASTFKLLSLTWETSMRLLQLIHGFFGILTLIWAWRLLKEFNFSKYAQLLSLAVLVFLPRHIYMSVMFTNDSLVFFSVLLCVWAWIRWAKHQRRRYAGWMCLALLAALFTKSNSLVLLPSILVASLMVHLIQPVIRKQLVMMALAILIPVTIYGGYLYQQAALIGNPLQMNIELLNFPIQQQPGDRYNYLDWSPAEFIEHPVLHEDNVDQFFPTLLARMWIEAEPKYSLYISKEENAMFWYQQNLWLNDMLSNDSPDDANLSSTYMFWTRLLLVLGIAMFLIFAFGILRSIRQVLVNRNQLPVVLFLLLLLAGNTAGIILTSWNYPYYSFVKAAFFLVSIPAFLYFGAKGFEGLMQFKLGKPISTVTVSALGFCVCIYIGLIIAGIYV